MSIQHGDIVLNSDSEIQAVNGDLVTGNAIEQHVGAIVNAHVGNFRRYPTLGANLDLDQDSPLNSRQIASKVTNALNLDGWVVDQLFIDQVNQEEIRVTIGEARKVTDETQSLI